GLTTESGFYYSFYDGFVRAPSWYAAFESVLQDSRSEYPDVIIPLQRFNIWPEVVCAVAFRAMAYVFLFLFEWSWNFAFLSPVGGHRTLFAVLAWIGESSSSLLGIRVGDAEWADALLSPLFGSKFASTYPGPAAFLQAEMFDVTFASWQFFQLILFSLNAAGHIA
ncbi:unnamed protein product, partial [Amoebophrya sp. A25]